MSTAVASDAVLERVVRDETAHLVATLHCILGDLDVAEEAVADAVVEALKTWRRNGIPDRPGGWLLTAARHNALDRLRRDSRYRDKLALLAGGLTATAPAPAGGQDERLGLIFGCCHPALARPAQLALTLRAVLGLTTAEIARASLTSESTIAQRIVRAKRKIVQAGIPVRVPGVDEMTERLDTVLTVVYLAYNEAYLVTGGPDPTRRDLGDDAIWLAGVVSSALPREPEALGLLALLSLHHARAASRFDGEGHLILLADQDRTAWDAAAIQAAIRLIERAAALRRPGCYQLQAAIAACHAEAPSWAVTDWLQILTLYDLLLRHDPSPVVRLNRAIALAQVEGSARALAELDTFAAALSSYYLLHATRAQLLRELGRGPEARVADQAALALTGNTAERHLLTERLRA